ncbi:STAS-like domain-containing protein [Salipiger thiooxidans]|uniref:STAS-like domain-containing protein n=1 Tax=Salipiger thiooxidans TaxID=282683 RepID=UPI001CFAAD16|nr:STAS-like domain-containing protein [Salipiger thiooxidans]
MTTTINIANDYTRFPGGRYPEDGAGNGTTFREDFLLPILEKGEGATVILDGAAGYPSSFLDEAFAGLVRRHKFTPDQVLKAFHFVAKEPGYARFVPLIESFVKSAVPKDRVVG